MLSQRVKFSSFLCLSSISLCKCPIVVLSTHLLKDTWAASYLGTCKKYCNEHRGAYVHRGTNTQISILGSFGYIPINGIAESKGTFIFNFLKYLYNAFHSGCTSLHSHQQCKRIPLSPPFFLISQKTISTFKIYPNVFELRF